MESFPRGELDNKTGEKIEKLLEAAISDGDAKEAKILKEKLTNLHEDTKMIVCGLSWYYDMGFYDSDE